MGSALTHVKRRPTRRVVTDAHGQQWVITTSRSNLEIKPYRARHDMTATIPWHNLYLAVSAHGRKSDRERRLQREEE